MKILKRLLVSLLLVLTVFSVSSIAQKSKLMTCYSDSWVTSTGNSGYAESTIKFNFKTLTYQRTTNGITYPQHVITDYQTGTLAGDVYVIMWVYSPDSELTKVGAYDKYIYEYYGDYSNSPFIMFNLYYWK